MYNKTMYTKKMKRRLGWIIVRKSPRIGRHAFLSGLFRRGIHYSWLAPPAPVHVVFKAFTGAFAFHSQLICNRVRAEGGGGPGGGATEWEEARVPKEKWRDTRMVSHASLTRTGYKLRPARNSPSCGCGRKTGVPATILISLTVCHAVCRDIPSNELGTRASTPLLPVARARSSIALISFDRSQDLREHIP